MKQFNSFRKFSRLCLGTMCLAIGGLACAQTFPGKIVKIVVPYPAGGGSDFVARLLQPEYQKLLGQTVIVDNVAGVGGALGVRKVLAAPADGHTQVLATPQETMLAPLAYSSIKYKAQDMRLAAIITTTPILLLVRADAPANNVEEFMAWARAKDISVGNSGVGSLYQLMANKLAQQAGLKFTQVSYKGGAQLMTDLASGVLDFAFLPVAGQVPAMVQSGRVKAIAIASPQAHPHHPAALPMSAHKALPGFNFEIWAGMQVPKATPDDAVDRINAAINHLLENPDIRKGLATTGATVARPQGRVELDRFYAAENERYSAMAEGLKPTPP